MPDESKVSESNIPKIALKAMTALLGNTDNVTRIYKVENYLCNKIEDIRSIFDPDTDHTRRNICFLLESLTNAKTLTHQQLLTMLYAIATGIHETMEVSMCVRGSASTSNQGTTLDDHSGTLSSLEELATLQRKLSDTTSGYQRTLETKEAALDALNVKVEVLVAETKRASEETARLKKALAAASESHESNIATLQRQHATAITKHDEQEKEYQEECALLRAKVESLESELAACKKQTDETSKALEALKTQHAEEIVAVENKYKKEIEDLTAKHAIELKSLDDKHSEAVNTFQSQLALSLAQCDALRIAVQKMKVEDEVVTTNKPPPPLPHADHEESKKYMENEKMITDLQRQVHTYQHQLFELQHRDDSHTKELEAATVVIADQRRSLEILAHEKFELEQKYLDLKETRYDGIDAGPEANHRMNMLLAQCESYRAALMELQQVAEHVVSDETVSVQHTIAELQRDAEFLRQENASLMKKVSESSKELTTIDSEVMEEQRKHIAHLEGQITTLKEQLNTLLPLENEEDERPLTPTRKSLTPSQSKITAIFEDDAMLPVFVTSQPILFIDVGCFTTHVGVWDPISKLFVSKYDIHFVLALTLT